MSLGDGVLFYPRVIPFRIFLTSFAPTLVQDSAGWGALATFLAESFGPQSMYVEAVRYAQAQTDSSSAFVVLDGFDEVQVQGGNFGETQRRRRFVLSWLSSLGFPSLYILVTRRLLKLGNPGFGIPGS